MCHPIVLPALGRYHVLSCGKLTTMNGRDAQHATKGVSVS
jgi:hypothetical protein